MTEREKLIDLLNDGCNSCEKAGNKSITEFLADYLLKNGVTIPLVKMGDTVYQTDNAGDIYESEVTKVVYGTNGIAFDERAIGESVFLTREEAEKACGLRGTKYEVPQTRYNRKANLRQD